MRLIDRLVYDLYGLTEDEMRVVRECELDELEAVEKAYNGAKVY